MSSTAQIWSIISPFAVQRVDNSAHVQIIGRGVQTMFLQCSHLTPVNKLEYVVTLERWSNNDVLKKENLVGLVPSMSQGQGLEDLTLKILNILERTGIGNYHSSLRSLRCKQTSTILDLRFFYSPMIMICLLEYLVDCWLVRSWFCSGWVFV